MFRSNKSKLDNNARSKRACSAAVNGLQTTLRIVQQATGDAGLPRLQTGIGDLLFVLDVIKKTSQNVEDVEKLSEQIEGLNLFLENSKNGETVATNRIDRLFIVPDTALEELRKMTSRNAIKRFIRYSDDAQSISNHIQTIAWSIQSFMVETTLAIEFALDEHAIRIQDDIRKLNETTTSGVEKITTRLYMKEGRPPYATFSAFNSKDRPQCLKGTRVEILNQIFHWIRRALKGKSRVAHVVAANICIFWINGSAGTGKTTIAYTVAAACKERGVLGASFFCSRDDAECSNPRLIFTSIAYQLGNFNRSFRAEVTRVMKSTPGIAYANPLYQLEELIVKPIRTLGSSFSPCVVVVDALDECKETGTTSAILSSLSLHVDERFPLRFLITSRLESHITTIFQSSNLTPITRPCNLHEAELVVVQSDIKHYLSSKLASTRKLYRIQDEWPSEADIHSLTLLSSALFIYASTSVRFIEDRTYSNPRDQLARLLCHATPATEPSSPDYRLDQLYTQALDDAFPTISPGLSGRLKRILGTIVLLQDPLSSCAIERLLGVQSGMVKGTLRHLHSVIMMPDDDNKMIRTLHPSFFDFITSPARCRNSKFVVNPGSQHTLLARACLDVMKGLKRDLCGIRNSSILNNEVDDLSARVMTCIPLELQYACRHWAWHLSNAMLSDTLLDLLKEFCLKYLLYWVEALSLMGDLRNGLLALDAARQAIGKAGRDVTGTMDLLRDCERLTLEFFPIISTCSLQVYHSALLFTPEEALIKKSYRRELDIPITVSNGLDTSWSLCIRTIEGHLGFVTSVTFSSDGTRIVSGSDDNTLRLWDAVSCAHLNTFKGHSSVIKSVSFSPDGTRIVSGSNDRTVRLWDALSGAHLNTSVGHSNSVTSIAFSPDGTRIASGSDDETVRLWDAVSGAHLTTFRGHSSFVNSVAFSPDGTRIVSGSNDKTARLWDTVSGVHLNTFAGHSSHVDSVTFSPDGTRIVSGSFDQTVRLWDTGSSVGLNTFKGHSSFVTSVAFSPDGTCIVSASNDKTARLWDAVIGVHLATFKGHSSCVNSVAFSPDGMRIVSGSNDQTVRLWDAVGGARPNTSTGHSNLVTSTAFSPDGTRIASGSYDKTIQLWDAVSGAHLTTFKGHSSLVNSLAFSPDGTRIISGSFDQTVRLWDAISNAHLNTFKGHSSSVNSVAFSPDGTRIISGSDDHTVRLWDAVIGVHLATFKGHSSCVRSVAFSPDNTVIISGSNDATIRLWDTVSCAHLNTFTGHSSPVESVAFSPDGMSIVSGSSDNTLQLWDAVHGANMKTFKGPFINVKSIAQSCNLSWNSLSTNNLNPTSSIFGYIAADGWVHSLTRNRRICWVPVSCRPVSLAANGARAVFGTGDGRVVILDFTGIDA